MRRLRLNFGRMGRALPPRRFFVERVLPIGTAGVVVLALCLAYPILLIPIVGLALPLYAGGRTLKSLFDDRRKASELALLQRNAAVSLRQAIDEKRVINLPVLVNDSVTGLLVHIVRFDEHGIETIDPIRKQPASYSWNEIDLELLCQNLGEYIRPSGESRTAELGAGNTLASWIKAISSSTSRRARRRSQR